MLLKNKLTGDVVEIKGNWKDYEPEEIWYITSNGEIECGNADISWVMEKMIGNYFESKEDAEEAVKKLEAWKRLRDRGFEFHGYCDIDPGEITFSLDLDGIMFDKDKIKQMEHDLALLFGGGE